MKRISGLVTVATLLASASSVFAQDSSWKLELGLDMNYTIGRKVDFDTSRSHFRGNMPNFTGFQPSFSLAPGEYNAGYVRPGVNPETGETEYWGADLDNPSALRLDDTHLDLKATSYTSSQSFTFTDHGGGSRTEDADSIMPMLRLVGWAPQDADSNFRWGLTGGLGWSPIDTETSHRAFDFQGYTFVDYTDRWDTYELAPGSGSLPNNAYYGDFGSSGPRLMFKPVSTRTETWSDKYSSHGWSDVTQSFDADLVELRFGLTGEWQWAVNNNDRIRLGIEGGPSLTIAHGSYSFSETISANIHEPSPKSFNYSESESSTDLLFGGYVQGRVSYQFDGNLSLGLTGGYSLHQDWEVGGAELNGGNWFVGAFASWEF